MNISTERAVLTASLFLKFARMTEPQKVLARQVMCCRSCGAETTCRAGQLFLEELRTLPVCPRSTRGAVQ